MTSNVDLEFKSYKVKSAHLNWNVLPAAGFVRINSEAVGAVVVFSGRGVLVLHKKGNLIQLALII